ncbi:hypothetical protein [Vibrio barjaei]|uniref:hypothetical protein n=1 Tax=Vibrio barjaei TaxID=1676683 RepID=UPI00228332BB|nr:hypothetical protein [Vibrio barjaei]MCY9874795.1 hypothetical protein [Vibrio barjaei]
MIESDSKVIREASTVLRFHATDGWARDSVRDLLESEKLEDIDFVIPVYYESGRLEQVREDMTLFALNPSCRSDMYDDADYFAVYHPQKKLCTEKLKKHTIVPFVVDVSDD